MGSYAYERLPSPSMTKGFFPHRNQPFKFQRHRRMLTLVSLIVISLLVCTGFGCFIDSDGYTDPSKLLEKARTRELVSGKNGIVSSENPLCSDIGLTMLKENGSAIDAAVATTVCIGVTNMYSSGIGGGGFMLARSGSGNVVSIDFREEAPKAAFTNMYKNNSKAAQFGGLAVGVPGELRGLELAHKKFGRLPWKRLFEPSIQLAAKGWKVNRVLAARIKSAESTIKNDTEFSRVFSRNGNVLVEGDWITRPKLAKALDCIANEGVSVFYEGWIGKQLVKTVQQTGGILTLEDMKAYQAKEQPALAGSYKGRTVYTGHPPSSGAVLLSVLNTIEKMNGFSNDSDLNLHLLVEAFKHAYAQRNFYGDPIDPVYRNITEIMSRFIAKEYSDKIRPKIHDNQTFGIDYYQPEFDVKDDHGTMHVSVAAADGTAVSLTSTVNLLFGSTVMDPETGIILNDQMDDFSLPDTRNAFGYAPSPYNFIYPHKRPLSSAVPTIIEKDGVLEIVAGASGGSRIITATTQAIIGMLDWNMNPAVAVHQPRAHHQLNPNVLTVENEFRDAATFTARGHNVSRLNLGNYLSGVAAIQVVDGTFFGSGDARKGGRAYGF